MFQVTQITSDALQTQNLSLPDSSVMTIQLYYVPQQYGWFINQLIYSTNNFTLTGMRVCNSPNMLQQFRNQIPFGIACYSANDREPSQIGDFSSQASVLYVLTQAEVAAYTAFLNGY